VQVPRPDEEDHSETQLAGSPLSKQERSYRGESLYLALFATSPEESPAAACRSSHIPHHPRRRHLPRRHVSSLAEEIWLEATPRKEAQRASVKGVQPAALPEFGGLLVRSDWERRSEEEAIGDRSMHQRRRSLVRARKGTIGNNPSTDERFQWRSEKEVVY